MGKCGGKRRRRHNSAVPGLTDEQAWPPLSGTPLPPPPRSAVSQAADAEVVESRRQRRRRHLPTVQHGSGQVSAAPDVAQDAAPDVARTSVNTVEERSVNTVEERSVNTVERRKRARCTQSAHRYHWSFDDALPPGWTVTFHVPLHPDAMIFVPQAKSV